MEDNTFSFSLDVAKANTQFIVNAVKGERNNSIQVGFTNGSETISLSGKTVYFAGVKPDGKLIYADTTIADDTATYTDASGQLCLETGLIVCQFIIIEGQTIKATASFVVVVNTNVDENRESVIASDNDLSGLMNISAAFEALIDDVETKLANHEFDGAPGEQGPQGEKGDPGDPGVPLYPAESVPPASYTTDYYYVPCLWIYDEQLWLVYNRAEITIPGSPSQYVYSFLELDQPDISGKMDLLKSLSDPSAVSSLANGQLFCCQGTYGVKNSGIPGGYKEFLTAHQDISGKMDKTYAADDSSAIAAVPTGQFFTGQGRLAHKKANGYDEIAYRSDVPTKTSDLTNDSGFLTAHQDISGKMDKTYEVYDAESIAEVPTGQLFTGQGRLAHKTSNGYDEIAYRADVPTKTSDLTNDSGFVTSQAVSGKMDKTYAANDSTAIAAVPTGQLFTAQGRLSHKTATGYEQIADLTDVPTKTSDLTNDSGFVNSQAVSGKMNLMQKIGDVSDLSSLSNGQVFTCQGAYGVKDTDQLSGYKEFLTSHQDISGKADKSTTLSGYGITDAYTKTEVNGLIPAVPTNVSAFTNDAGYLTSHQSITGKMDKTYAANDAESIAEVPTGQLFTAQGRLAHKTAIGYEQIASLTDIPTKTSDLTNDSGFLTAHQDVSGKMNKTYAANDAESIAAVPTGQMFTAQGRLSHKTANGYEQIANLTDIPTVPTNVSFFTNDAGYLTAHQSITGKMDKMYAADTSSAIASVPTGQIFTGQGQPCYKTSTGYEQLALLSDVPTVPTNVSSFTNDAGYLTSHQSISGKEDTSNKVTSISSSSTNTQYPSALAVKNYVDTVIGGIENGAY